MAVNLIHLPENLFLSQNDKQHSSSKLHDAATQFEALMITEMMKTARESNDGGVDNGDETGEDSSLSMAEQQLAQSIASNGGLGLAKMVERTLSRSTNTSANPAPQVSLVR